MVTGFKGDLPGKWSPDMKKFAFYSVAQSSIWVIDVSPDTSKPTSPPKKIVENVFKENTWFTPKWSPNSKWIAFPSDRAGIWDVWIVSPDGSNLTRLTDDPLSNGLYSWSPDGKSIAYSKRRPDAKSSDTWVIPAEGGKPEKLVTVENAAGAEYSPDGKWLGFRTRKWSDKGWIEELMLLRLSDKHEFWVTVPEDLEKPISWSRDSKQILFFKTGYDWKSSLKVVNAYGGPSVELGKECKLMAWAQMWTRDSERIVADSDTDYWWIIPTKGGPSVKLELRPEPKSRVFVAPSFSPDLTKSAYVTEDGSLWALPISINEAKAIGKPVKIGEKVEGGIHVSWSPDSKWIAFPSKAGGSRDIWIASMNGGEARQLTKMPGDEPGSREGGISRSPDSKWIAYSDKEGLWVVPSSGGEPRQLVKSESATDPAWSSDGKEIAFIEESYISIVNAQTGEIKHILDLKAHNLDGKDMWCLKWSPDGKRLGFIGTKDQRYCVWVVSASGGDLMELADDDPGDKYYLFWSPDGKKVSYSSERHFKVRTGAIWALDIEELVSKME